MDAIFFGQREPIPMSEIPDEGKYHNRRYQRIRCRRPDVVRAERERVLLRLRNIAKNLELGFMSAGANSTNGLPDGKDAHTLGRTVFNTQWYSKTKILVAIEMVEPLLRTDLTVAEHTIEIFRLASILTHEVAVSNALERKA